MDKTNYCKNMHLFPFIFYDIWVDGMVATYSFLSVMLHIMLLFVVDLRLNRILTTMTLSYAIIKNIKTMTRTNCFHLKQITTSDERLPHTLSICKTRLKICSFDKAYS